MGLGEILDRDAFIAGERRDEDLHMVLLDELLHRAYSGIWGRVGRCDDELELLAARLAAVFLHRRIETGDPVDAQYGVGAFERRGDADLDLILRPRRARQQDAGERQSADS